MFFLIVRPSSTHNIDASSSLLKIPRNYWLYLAIALNLLMKIRSLCSSKTSWFSFQFLHLISTTVWLLFWVQNSQFFYIAFRQPHFVWIDSVRYYWNTNKTLEVLHKNPRIYCLTDTDFPACRCHEPSNLVFTGRLYYRVPDKPRDPN